MIPPQSSPRQPDQDSGSSGRGALILQALSVSGDRCYTLEVESDTLVKHLKKRIRQQRGPPVSQQRLVREGSILQDDRLVLSYIGNEEHSIPEVPLMLVVMPPRREEVIEQSVRSLLNKVCPDNFNKVVDQLMPVELHSADELEIVAGMIFRRALAEPYYCNTYVDMVHALRTRYPEFPPKNEGEKATTFMRAFLNVCQNEFEDLPMSLVLTEEEKHSIPADGLRTEIQKRKDELLACMQFIGSLFLRQLLAVQVIGQVVHDLIGIRERLPEEHMIEGACLLLQQIGLRMDGTAPGKLLMSQFLARLIELKQCSALDGRAAFSIRTQFQIQNLIDLRQNSWQKNIFNERVKIEEDARRADHRGAP